MNRILAICLIFFVSLIFNTFADENKKVKDEIVFPSDDDDGGDDSSKEIEDRYGFINFQRPPNRQYQTFNPNRRQHPNPNQQRIITNPQFQQENFGNNNWGGQQQNFGNNRRQQGQNFNQQQPNFGNNNWQQQPNFNQQQPNFGNNNWQQQPNFNPQQQNFDNNNWQQQQNFNPQQQNSGNNNAQQPQLEIEFPLEFTTRSPQVQGCIEQCVTLIHYNPVCGTNRMTYINRERFDCAVDCGDGVQIAFEGPCPRRRVPQWQRQT